MIVVIGSPRGCWSEGRVVATGAAAAIAIAVAGAGEAVQLVGRIGDDAVADAVLADLSRQGVGHVAILRDAAHPTPLDDPLLGTGTLDDGGLPLDGDDVALALRYLVDFAVVVLTQGMSAAAREVATDAASWDAAALIVVETAGGESGDALAARVAAIAVREAQVRSAR